MQSVGLQGRSRRRRCRRRSIMHAIMHARTTRESMIECALAWLACMRIRQDGRPQGPATATAVSAVTTPPTPRARATLYVSNVDQRTSHVGMRECACTDIGLIRAHVVVRRRARALRDLGFISKGGGGGRPLSGSASASASASAAAASVANQTGTPMPAASATRSAMYFVAYVVKHATK